MSSGVRPNTPPDSDTLLLPRPFLCCFRDLVFWGIAELVGSSPAEVRMLGSGSEVVGPAEATTRLFLDFFLGRTKARASYTSMSRGKCVAMIHNSHVNNRVPTLNRAWGGATEGRQRGMCTMPTIHCED